jgi:hypothetical protein
MGKKPPSKHPRPSYEEGELRDKSIEEMQDKRFQPSDLKRLIERAIGRKPLRRAKLIRVTNYTQPM